MLVHGMIRIGAQQSVKKVDSSCTELVHKNNCTELVHEESVHQVGALHQNGAPYPTRNCLRATEINSTIPKIPP